jgi:deazaflavin-dependent oxidoreductase (nitroreductase family)
MSAANGALNPLVSFVYRITGGRVPSRMGTLPVMLLTTTGFKSGRQRTNPVLYLVDGENLVTAASAGGSDKNPAWLANLMHNPLAVVTIKRERRVVLARKATPEERNRLWPLLTERFHGYENYSKKTKRLIPVVIFSPA